ncbi:hypothetical protein S7335_3, partial [Synechococcus sp. PCC 7335]
RLATENATTPAPIKPTNPSPINQGSGRFIGRERDRRMNVEKVDISK